MKLKHLLTLVLMAVAGSVWAETTVLYEKGTEGHAWSEADKTTWGASELDATYGLRQTGGNGSNSASLTIAPKANSVINVEAYWVGMSNIGRRFDQGNCSYFNYAGVWVEENDQDKASAYSINGFSSSNFTTFTNPTGCANRAYDIATKCWYVIKMQINTATNTLESLTVESSDKLGTKLVDISNKALTNPDYTKVVFGYLKTGGVNTTNNEYLKSLVITETTQDVTSADYTINYVFEGNVIKTESGNEVVGETVNAVSPITIEGQKYYATSSTSMTVDADAAKNVLNVELRKANVYTYSVKNSFGELLQAVTEGIEGETYTVAYPKYILSGTDLYLAETSTGEKSFSKYITLTENTEAIVNYTKHLENIVYFSEAEDVEGATVYNSCSNTSTFASGDLAVFSNLAHLTTLTAGYYKFYARTLGRTDRYFDFYNGNGDDKVSLFHPGCAGFYNCGEQVSGTIILNSSTDIYFQGGYGTTSTNGNVVDLFYIQKVGDALTVNTDATFLINNPNIDGNANGWTIEKRNGGNGPLKDNAVMEYWAGNATNRDEAGFDYYQTLNNLPNGYYTVSAEMKNSLNDEAGAVFNESCGVYGNDVMAYVTVEGDILNRYTTAPIFVTDGTLRLGVKSDKRMGARWFVADNFTLTYLGESAATLAVNAEAKYGTFCAPFDVDVPEGVNASTATLAENGETITLTSVGTTIPANTPVVLYAENGLDATHIGGIATAIMDPTAGVLHGVYSEMAAPVGSYVLQNQTSGVGFYKVGETKPIVGANRAYLTVPAGENARFFGFGEETAIKAIDALTAGKAEIFDLQGRRLNSLQKGINIVNGVKILVK